MYSLDSSNYWHITATIYGRVEQTFGSLPSLNNILEIGCSYGETTKEISEIFPNAQIYAVDINKECIIDANLRKYGGNVNLRNMDGYRANEFFPEESFDGIFLMNNLAFSITEELITEKIIRTIFKNLSISLKNEGRIFISERSSHIILKKKKCLDFELERSKIFNSSFGLSPILDILNI